MALYCSLECHSTFLWNSQPVVIITTYQWGGASFDPRIIIRTDILNLHLTLLHHKYQNLSPFRLTRQTRRFWKTVMLLYVKTDKDEENFDTRVMFWTSLLKVLLATIHIKYFNSRPSFTYITLWRIMWSWVWTNFDHAAMIWTNLEMVHWATLHIKYQT